MAKHTKLTSDQLASLTKFMREQAVTARELSRAQSIMMYEKDAEAELITELTGLKRSALFKWRGRFVDAGVDALVEKRAKPKKLMTRSQIKEIVEELIKSTPRDHGYDTDFWTTGILAERIKDKYNVEYKTKKQFYLVFKEAKFSYHKPGGHYHNRQQNEIDEWIKINTPIIKQHLETPNTVVLTGDEMVLSTRTTFQKVWLPQNSYPKVDISNERKNQSIYGFLNIANGTQHAFQTDWQNSTITCDVLEQLCRKYLGKQIVLIWDNAGWHRSKQVRDWLANTAHKIHLIALPRYAPELNPQEHVWKAGRAQISHNKFIGDIKSATSEFVAYLNNQTFKYKFLD